MKQPQAAREQAPRPGTDRQNDDFEVQMDRMKLGLNRLAAIGRSRIRSIENCRRKARVDLIKLRSAESEFHRLGGWGQLDDELAERTRLAYRCYLDQYVCPELCQEIEAAGGQIGSLDLPRRYQDLPVSYETFLLYGVARLETPGHRHPAGGAGAPCRKRAELIHQKQLVLKTGSGGGYDDGWVSVPISSPAELARRHQEGDFSRSSLIGNCHDGLPAADELAAYIPPPALADDSPVSRQLLRTAAAYLVTRWRQADQTARLEREKQVASRLAGYLDRAHKG